MAVNDALITIDLHVKLNACEAMAMANFCKRAGISDYIDIAIGDSEANAMLVAHCKIQAALAENGYAPR